MVETGDIEDKINFVIGKGIRSRGVVSFKALKDEFAGICHIYVAEESSRPLEQQMDGPRFF
jgi:hypothetical protein